MKNRRLLCIILAVVMLLSVSACGAAASSTAPQTTEAPKAEPQESSTPAPAPAAETTASELPLSDVDEQLILIHSQVRKLEQKDGEQPWFYTVTDLDHNGRLEFIASVQHPKDRSENLKVWEVSEDRKELKPCTVKLEEDETFPDFMTDASDTYHVTDGDSWHYMFYDNIVISDTEVFTRKSALNLKDGVISYEPYAIEHTEVVESKRQVSYMDGTGAEISQADYNASGDNGFAGAERSSTAFDWVAAKDMEELSRLIDCYAVFTGRKKAPDVFPVPKPTALQHPAMTPAPAATNTPTATPAPAATPVPAPIYLTITKNPTNEPGRKIGGTAQFVACANVFDSLTWTMVSPQGGEYTPEAFARMYPEVSVSGYYSTTLSISNLIFDVGGWGAYCTFYYGGQSARTTTAYVYVSDTKPEPSSQGRVDGTVTDWNYSYVWVSGNDGRNVAIDWNIVSITGEVYNGAPMTYFWSGNKDNITICYITGEEPPSPPKYASMAGNAYSGGGGYAIDLDNGTQVYVDAWLCSVEGNFYEGCYCIVYYTDYPSAENIYNVDIYGDMGLIIPEEDQGGWAGSNYYDNEIYNTGNAVETLWGSMPTHESPNGDGTFYEAFWCPNCGAEVSLAQDRCPVCGIGLF